VHATPYVIEFSENSGIPTDYFGHFSSLVYHLSVVACTYVADSAYRFCRFGMSPESESAHTPSIDPSNLRDASFLPDDQLVDRMVQGGLPTGVAQQVLQEAGDNSSDAVIQVESSHAVPEELGTRPTKAQKNKRRARASFEGSEVKKKRRLRRSLRIKSIRSQARRTSI
jgi:hypothetical protein